MNDSLVPIEEIGARIHLIRGQRVMLDQDLAALYGVKTKVLNQAVRRNKKRFPGDFMFLLNPVEAEASRSQFVTLKETRDETHKECSDSKDSNNLRSQIVTSSFNYGGRRYLPCAFTEQGVAMLSSVLRSSKAVTVNIEIMRAFVRMRHALESNKEMAKAVTDLRTFVLRNSNKVDQEFRRVWQKFDELAKPPADAPRIGFRLD